MTRYVAFLRGISPMNLKMPELKRCFESAGFTEVKTLLSSGNVVFNAKGNASSVERRAEEAMSKDLGRKFYTIVRSISDLGAMIETIELDGACILESRAREVFSAYVPGPRGPVFMGLIEKAFGSEVTTRTWETVKKCAKG